jgi:hypothetical protein
MGLPMLTAKRPPAKCGQHLNRPQVEGAVKIPGEVKMPGVLVFAGETPKSAKHAPTIKPW